MALRHRLGIAGHTGDIGEIEHVIPAWVRSTEAENKIPASLAVLAAIAMQATLPPRFSLHPVFLVPALELALLIALTVANPVRLTRQNGALRTVAIAMAGVITVANGISAGLLAYRLVEGTAGENAGPLLLSGGAIYLTNIVAFGLIYWELDRGGPASGRQARAPIPTSCSRRWQPRGGQPRVAAAIPRLPLCLLHQCHGLQPDRHAAVLGAVKILMAVQSAIALVTVALVVARAVNILK